MALPRFVKVVDVHRGEREVVYVNVDKIRKIRRCEDRYAVCYEGPNGSEGHGFIEATLFTQLTSETPDPGTADEVPVAAE